MCVYISKLVHCGDSWVGNCAHKWIHSTIWYFLQVYNLRLCGCSFLHTTMKSAVYSAVNSCGHWAFIHLTIALYCWLANSSLPWLWAKLDSNARCILSHAFAFSVGFHWKTQLHSTSPATEGSPLVHTCTYRGVQLDETRQILDLTS